MHTTEEHDTAVIFFRIEYIYEMLIAIPHVGETKRMAFALRYSTNVEKTIVTT